MSKNEVISGLIALLQACIALGALVHAQRMYAKQRADDRADLIAQLELEKAERLAAQREAENHLRPSVITSLHQLDLDLRKISHELTTWSLGPMQPSGSLYVAPASNAWSLSAFDDLQFIAAQAFGVTSAAFSGPLATHAARGKLIRSLLRRHEDITGTTTGRVFKPAILEVRREVDALLDANGNLQILFPYKESPLRAA